MRGDRGVRRSRHAATSLRGRPRGRLRAMTDAALEDLAAPDAPGLRPVEGAREAGVAAPGSRRRGSWRARAAPASRRTTGRGPRPGTAGAPHRGRGHRGAGSPRRAPRSRGARVGGGTSGGRSSAALPLLLVPRLRRPAGTRRPVVGCRVARTKRKAADPGVRVPRPRGGPVERASSVVSPRGGSRGRGAVDGAVGDRRRRAASGAPVSMARDEPRLRCRRADAAVPLADDSWTAARGWRRRLTDAAGRRRGPRRDGGRSRPGRGAGGGRGPRWSSVDHHGAPSSPWSGPAGRPGSLGLQLVCAGTLMSRRPKRGQTN